MPDVVQFDRGAGGRPALVQTYDAGVTVDHWATLLPVQRDGAILRHVFEDCAHWWALARHCLIALDAIHELQLVHLDLKADNVCIPVGPADFDPRCAGAARCSRASSSIALIDFAFSLVSGERLDSALPIARQTDYDYQSPRLLRGARRGPPRRPAADAPARLALRPVQPRGDAAALPARARAAPMPAAGRRRATRRRGRWCAACSRRTTPSCRRCGRMPS